jgi:hypothetical protein
VIICRGNRPYDRPKVKGESTIVDRPTRQAWIATSIGPINYETMPEFETIVDTTYDVP